MQGPLDSGPMHPVGSIRSGRDQLLALICFSSSLCAFVVCIALSSAPWCVEHCDIGRWLQTSGRWSVVLTSHESGATQAEINIHLSMMSALSIYTVLMRTNSPKQPGCLQFFFVSQDLRITALPRVESYTKVITVNPEYFVRILFSSISYAAASVRK